MCIIFCDKATTLVITLQMQLFAHTSKYYNVRVPEQRGIHAFGKPECLNCLLIVLTFVGRAEYINNVQKTAWEIAKQTNAQVDTVYMLYDFLID